MECLYDSGFETMADRNYAEFVNYRRRRAEDTDEKNVFGVDTTV